jgi:hypothetical protein
MTTEWIIAVCALLTVLSAVASVIWKFSKSVDRLSYISTQTLDQIKAQWSKIDSNKNFIEDVKLDHGTRIVKLETWRDIHEKIHEAAGGNQ